METTRISEEAHKRRSWSHGLKPFHWLSL